VQQLVSHLFERLSLHFSHAMGDTDPFHPFFIDDRETWQTSSIKRSADGTDLHEGLPTLKHEFAVHVFWPNVSHSFNERTRNMRVACDADGIKPFEQIRHTRGIKLHRMGKQVFMKWILRSRMYQQEGSTVKRWTQPSEEINASLV
jgi:hypothetical protein